MLWCNLVWLVVSYIVIATITSASIVLLDECDVYTNAASTEFCKPLPCDRLIHHPAQCPEFHTRVVS